MLLALWTSEKIVGFGGSVSCFVTLARILNLSVFPWEYERGVRKGEAWCLTHRRCPINKDHFHFSSPVLRTESLVRNVCQKTFLVSLYWYFLPVNYTCLNFFLIIMRCLESSCLSTLILAGPCIQVTPALLFACLLFSCVQVSAGAGLCEIWPRPAGAPALLILLWAIYHHPAAHSVALGILSRSRIVNPGRQGLGFIPRSKLCAQEPPAHGGPSVNICQMNE